MFCLICETGKGTKATVHWRHLPRFGRSVLHLSFDPQTLCQSHYHHRPPACSFGHQTVNKMEINGQTMMILHECWQSKHVFHTSSINLAWPCWSMGLIAFCTKPTEPGYSILLPNEWAIRKLEWKKSRHHTSVASVERMLFILQDNLT